MNSLGKSHRQVITLIDLFRMLPDDESAHKWFEKVRWPGGVECPHCGSDKISEKNIRKPMPYRCRTCRKHFSVRHGTLMKESQLPLQKWAIAIYLCVTNLKSVSSMKLHRDLGITQKTARSMMRRILEAFPVGFDPFAGPVEVDETYMGGKCRNMSNAKRRQMREDVAGRGAVGKTAVVGAKDRQTNKVTARVVESTD